MTRPGALPYPPPCLDATGQPHGAPSEGRVVAPSGRPVTWRCRACAEAVIAEYAEKLGERWTFVPFEAAP